MWLALDLGGADWCWPDAGDWLRKPPKSDKYLVTFESLVFLDGLVVISPRVC